MNINANMPLHIVLAEWALYQENKPGVQTDKFITDLEVLRLSAAIEYVESAKTPTVVSKIAKQTLLDFYKREKEALENLRALGMKEISVGIVRHP